VQISTEDQYVLNYSVHPNPTDTLTLAAHVEDFVEQLDTTPQTLTADAGYGSEQNYEMMEQKGIEAYVKYNYFDKEQQGTREEFAAERLYYNEQNDYVVCSRTRTDRLSWIKRKTAPTKPKIKKPPQNCF
jgi:hypothetical protein